MRFSKLWVISGLITVASLSFVVLADQNADTSNGQSMPMMQGHQGNMPMMHGMQGQPNGMPMMQMMQQRQAKMDDHMQKMETHMANIKALLEQLVELQKQ